MSLGQTLQVYILPGAKLCSAHLTLQGGSLLSTPLRGLGLFFLQCICHLSSKWTALRDVNLRMTEEPSQAGSCWLCHWFAPWCRRGAVLNSEYCYQRNIGSCPEQEPVERTLKSIPLQCFYYGCLLEEEFIYPHGHFPKSQHNKKRAWQRLTGNSASAQQYCQCVTINKAILFYCWWGSAPASTAFHPVGSVGKVMPQEKNHNWISSILYLGG